MYCVFVCGYWVFDEVGVKLGNGVGYEEGLFIICQRIRWA